MKKTKYEIEQAKLEKKASRLRKITGSAVLEKACLDPFDYAVGLKNGTVIRFMAVNVISDKVIELLDVHGAEQPPTNFLPYPVPRGVEIMVSEIAWAADAPIGS